MPHRWLPAFAALAACSPSLDDVVSRVVERGFEGVIHVEHRGERLVFDAWGDAVDAATGQDAVPHTTGTVFSVGSLTKQFTGAAIVEAEHRGLLSVDDTLPAHFADVPERFADVTLHDLLTHRGGLEGAIGFDNEAIDRDAYLARTWATDHRPEVGRFAYSNVGYSLLAAALEQASGREYESLLLEWFFEPLGMAHTGYESPDYGDAVIAHGYAGDEVFGPPLTAAYDSEGPFWHLTGNGGVLSTADDMHRWTRALIDGEVLTEAGRDAVWDRHVSQGVPGFWYGYGWATEEWGWMGHNVNHDGGNGFFHAFVVWWPEDELYISTFTNRDGRMQAGMAWQLSRAVLR